MSQGYEALHSGAAMLELSNRGRIRATGEDRARLLHALTTNHIQQLKPGEGAYAFFLTAQGRILGDAHILCFEDALLVDVEPETRTAVLKHIDHYIIADDVTLEDTTGSTFEIAVEGPRSSEVLMKLGAPAPGTAESHAAWDTATVARITSTGVTGFRIFGRKEGEPALRAVLESAGVVPAAWEDARTVRIENALPRYGEDFSAGTLPQETGLARALHFSKGCYLGQEIVERIRSRGHVNKVLAGLDIEAKEPAAAGTTIMLNEAETGELTSSAYSPAGGKVVAIGMLRVQSARPGTVLRVAGANATVRAAS